MNRPSPNEQHPTVVVYDLDGVFTRLDTYTAFTIEQLLRRPLRLLRAIPIAVSRLFSEDEESRRLGGVRIARIALSGLHDAEYTRRVNRFGRLIGNNHWCIRATAVVRVRRQKAQGATIIIATATDRRLAQPLLEHAGVPYDLLSASELSVTPTAMDVTDHRLGPRKVEALREQDVPIDQAEFVTDSITDLPTAQAAAQVVLIGASRKTREKYRQAGVAVIAAES